MDIDDEAPTACSIGNRDGEFELQNASRRHGRVDIGGVEAVVERSVGLVAPLRGDTQAAFRGFPPDASGRVSYPPAHPQGGAGRRNSGCLDRQPFPSVGVRRQRKERPRPGFLEPFPDDPRRCGGMDMVEPVEIAAVEIVDGPASVVTSPGALGFREAPVWIEKSLPGEEDRDMARIGDRRRLLEEDDGSDGLAHAAQEMRGAEGNGPALAFAAEVVGSVGLDREDLVHIGQGDAPLGRPLQVLGGDVDDALAGAHPKDRLVGPEFPREALEGDGSHEPEEEWGLRALGVQDADQTARACRWRPARKIALQQVEFGRGQAGQRAGTG